MARAPLPDELPGTFFVLEWDRARECFILHIDDEDGSSYNLGNVIETVMMRFRIWGLPRIGNRAIDAAREFGVVQVLPEEDRIINLINRDVRPDRSVHFEPVEGREGRHVTLPRLGPNT